MVVDPESGTWVLPVGVPLIDLDDLHRIHNNECRWHSDHDRSSTDPATRAREQAAE